MSTAASQTSLSVSSSPPRGLRRFVLRLPIWLYRLHLGWLLGDRFLLLIHRGRMSGLRRRTMIEIIRHDRATDRCVVAAGWGSKSDWFRNIQQTPEVTIVLGLRQWAARAECLSETEGASELLGYARNHPRAFREITRLLVGRSIAGTEENCRELAGTIPIVAFQPVDVRQAKGNNA